MATLNVFDIQPNSDKRNEFLIVLDYLLHHTGDEKHATSQTSIVKYAKDEYNVIIRRDRIPQILLHLSQLVDKYPDKFPFKLKSVQSKSATDEEDGARRKYYISERAFTDKEILKIVSAIQSDKTISTDATNKLVDKLLKETASDNKIEILKKKLEKKQRKTSKFTDRGMDYLEKIEEMAANYERVWFTINDYADADFDRPRFVMTRMMREKKEHVGYIYAVKEVNNKFVAIVYLSEYKHAMITPLTNIVITNHLDLNDISNPIDFAIDNDKFASIDEWVEKHYKGQDGRLQKFEFKYTLGHMPEKDQQYIETTFRRHWKKELEYTIKDRDVEVNRLNENGEVYTETITVQDAHVVIETTIESFKHWYMDYKIFSYVVIVQPAFFNDHWLGTITNRLVRRLSKYGARYNYELTRTPKPDYSEMLERNHLEFEKRRKERETSNEGSAN